MASDSGKRAPQRVVKCPQCGGDSIYSPGNPYRPFCSARCKGLDLGAWASESFRVPDETPPDDQPFGDPKLQ
ncbi:DNA gyrase inhibitor YacG [Ramlibacter tataouinensis]|uniref:DNA gyrase inhibitor YacG n=1 Tax=Ramlibacter tataouinensis TaxID=94132 RepID=UPI0022F3DB36|nr:DNA gyrase inhibitor YacG [Ramlibacter tataouinensis]WBY00831.1 DNA gyrase inhibitor YacG [Ramlibacter tataouinensis]